MSQSVFLLFVLPLGRSLLGIVLINHPQALNYFIHGRVTWCNHCPVKMVLPLSDELTSSGFQV